MHMKKLIFAISLAVLSSLPAIASAATISLQAVPAHIGAGDVVRVDILLDSAIPVNAFSGTLLYPKTLEPIGISDGNSIVSLWVTHPVVSEAGAPISFVGITPGGFSGNGGVLFSVLFKAKTSGTANVSLGNVEVLRNDGAGGKEPVTLKSLVLSISSKSSGGYTEPVDHTPPEPFTAQQGSDLQLFDGKNYLAFMAVDKGSGVDHYEIAESRVPSFLFWLLSPSWHAPAISPFVLADQNLTSAVYIKAVDRAGNERLSVYPLRYLFTAYETIVLFVILVVVVLLWEKKIWLRRRPRKNP